MKEEKNIHKIFAREASGDGCELRVVCETQPQGTVQCYDRIVGGDGCELTVIRPPDDAPAATPHERAPVYPANESLPPDIREQLPPVVQTLYREAYNHAWDMHVMPLRRGLTASHHQAASRAAWTAVRRLYTQMGTTWVRRRIR